MGVDRESDPLDGRFGADFHDSSSRIPDKIIYVKQLIDIDLRK
jgi:hypothetical protein